MKLKYDVPLSDFAFKFNLRRYNEERIWGMHNIGVSLTSPFKMRVAFQQSELGAAAGEVPKFDKLDWTSRMGIGSAMVRRLLTTVSIPAGQGGAGRSFWTFKVGRIRLTVSKPVLKAPMVSALETRIS